MSDSDKNVDYNVNANPSGFVDAMQKAQAAGKESAAKINDAWKGMGATFEAVNKYLFALTAVLAGGKIFKDAIGEANKLNAETMGLAKAMSISGTEASALRTALDDIGTDSDTYIGAFRQFAKQVKNNEEGLQAMGLRTRDANGHLRDSNELFTEAVKEVGNYKPGLDQTTAAMTLFGKGVDDVMKLQRLNSGVIEEAMEKNKQLGLTITKEGVEGSKKYKAALNDLGDVLLGIQNAIGQAVMPVFTRLAEWLSGAGPTAVFVVKTAFNALATAMQAVVLVAKTVWNVISALANPLFTFGGALKKLINGDMAGATVDMMKIGSNWREALSGVWDNIAEDAKRSWTEVQTLWTGGTAVPVPGKGTKTMGDFDKTNKDKKKEAPSRMGDWEASLAQTQAGIERQGLLEGQFRQQSRAETLSYWQELLQRQDLTTQEKTQLVRKAADVEMAAIRETFDVKVKALEAESAQYKNNFAEKLRIETEIQAKYAAGTKEFESSQGRINALKRDAAAQDAAAAQVRIDAARQADLAALALEVQTLQTSAQLGLVSQEQVLTQQVQFEERRNAIAQVALEERRANAALDPDTNPVLLEQIHAQIEAQEQQHQLKLSQIRGQAAVNNAKDITSTLGSVQSSWASLIGQLAQGSLTIGGFIKGVFKSVTDAVIQTLAAMAARWLVQQVAMLIFTKASGLSTVATESAKAGAGGVASMAAAPFPLNLSAPAFGAAMAALAMSFAPLASARGGYDIPAGLNPMTQLHEREMVLPSKHADVIRGLADGQPSGQGGGSPVHIHGSPDDTIKLRDLGRALKQLNRDFVFVGQR